MAIDLTGIDNRGEFYSHHYLDALLESDLKPLWKRWAEAEQDSPGFRSPDKRLPGLGGSYFEARERASEPGATALERLEAARPFHARWLEALGYARNTSTVALEDGSLLALVHEERRGGHPELWVLETGFPEAGEDPLDQRLLPEQVEDEDAGKLSALSLRELLDRELFRVAEPPTWVLVLSGSEVLLTHRHKWGRGKALAFDLDELFARRQAKSFKALAGLLHADALVPGDGPSLHEHLDEASHKHAFAVSGDLRQGAEQAIELLGNEAAWYLREVRKQAVFGEGDKGIDAAQLTRDCLVFLYRLIFLFYVEARSEELGIAPMKAEAYRKGYSLESLRELEQVPLTSPQAQQGFYLHDSLQQLFRLVDQGYPSSAQVRLGGTGDGAAFRMRGLHSRLFDDGQLPVLSKVRLRNLAVQKIIALLSLSKEGAHKERGRISYASLGINQLGAVYEGLLSYTGFFAKEDLVEVVNAGERDKADARTFFVPARHRDRYEDTEIVREGKEGPRKTWPRGSFLYRLAGRDREKSASYYTPEVLTRCLVRYTLKERLGEGEDAIAADEILGLSVCEPAMGSGAFLNETVDQLAEAYLERKQAELGRRVEPERYRQELARVKAHIAANNCYGVDLNPLACELGKVSLWLNVLRPGARAPFFDPRLQAGNSLVGARLATYGLEVLHKASKKAGPNWLKLAPQPLEGKRAGDRVYQFLLPAEGMADFAGDKVVKALVPEQVEAIKAWQKSLNRAWNAQEKGRLLRLSEHVDALWAEHARARRQALEACSFATSVWPQPERPDAGGQDEAELARLWKRAVQDDLAGRRLKQAMDLWCALWFWPLDQAELLPSRGDWLSDLESVLDGRLPAAESVSGRRLAVAARVAEQHRFVHWEWAFPEVFERGGFDVVVGNPPWLKLQWNESGVLSDLDPRMVIRRQTAKQVADLRAETLEGEEPLAAYLAEFQELTGQKAFLNGVGNYPLLQGVQTNLYKLFLVRCWRVVASRGAVGLLHQAGMFDDPRGWALRSEFYRRARLVARFQNKLSLFESILHTRYFVLTVSSGTRSEVPIFRSISNLFHPITIDESYSHDGLGEVPDGRLATGEWGLRGHRSRLVEITEDALAVFASVFDGSQTPALHARLPVVHSEQVLRVLFRLGSVPTTLGDEQSEWYATECFHETNAQHDGLIIRDSHRPSDRRELVLSGPHFYVANPFRRDPNLGCRTHLDYSTTDLSIIDGKYLPRSNYRGCGDRPLAEDAPRWDGESSAQHYRHVHRRMISGSGERSLICALIPPGVTHIHTIVSAAFRSAKTLTTVSGTLSSLPADYLLKTTGKSDLTAGSLSMFPLLGGACVPPLQVRTLLLNCLTEDYADLWSDVFRKEFSEDGFTRQEPRLGSLAWSNLAEAWSVEHVPRLPLVRRQLMVEIDALVALGLGLSADELCLIYRVQFPLLRINEADTWYDRRGRIVFTNNRGLNGVGIAQRKDWESIREAQTEADLPEADWTSDALGRYQPPFDRCDRETDMRQAYEEFVRRGIEPAKHQDDA
jgi:hypothetical protein